LSLTRPNSAAGAPEALIILFTLAIAGFESTSLVLEERVDHDIALSSARAEVDRKKRCAADITISVSMYL
jgi:hypothetical protein